MSDDPTAKAMLFVPAGPAACCCEIKGIGRRASRDDKIPGALRRMPPARNFWPVQDNGPALNPWGPRILMVGIALAIAALAFVAVVYGTKP